MNRSTSVTPASARRQSHWLLNMAGFSSAITAAAFLLFAPSIRAEEGVTPDSVVIGRVIALNGPAGAKGREQEAALHAYFGALNSSGGIYGRKIVLRTTNEDLRGEEAMRRIYDGQRPFALFLFGGTPGSIAAMSYATAMNIPFVAPNSGADIFHQPPNRWVFNVRARYQDEVMVAIKHFYLVGQRRVALINVDDPFGRDGAAGYKEAVRVTGVTSVYEGSFAADKPDFAKHVNALLAATPDSVVCIGSSKRVAELIVSARGAGVLSAFMTLSNNASAGFVQELGRNARGVIVSQVTPSPGNWSTKLSQELRKLMANKPDAEISYAAMEAYASAKVLIEGLRRAGPKLTRERFIQALEGMNHLDIGDFYIDYSSTRRTGSSYVELTILTKDGRYSR